ncbi:MAG: hypothetical protein RL701_6455 [Pseudomonadota bacterium]|jgi:hypothetical protein
MIGRLASGTACGYRDRDSTLESVHSGSEFVEMLVHVSL